MLKEIVVNVGEEETRVAVLEDNVPVEIYIERSVNQRLVGNIFKGRVENVLPGMQAAFVNIGLEKISLDDFTAIIESKNRNKAGFSVPAHGLYLTKVEYPYLRK